MIVAGGSRAVVVVLGLLCSSGAAPIQTSEPPGVQVEVVGHPAPGARVPGLVNVGTLPLAVDLARVDGGQARVDRDLTGDAAIRLPAHVPGGDMPRAVVRVRHEATSGDPLAPGNRAFTFGASFNLDQVSTGSAVDDGNNIMQRGMWGDPAQYKLQVDDDRLSCRVAGSGGSVLVRSSLTVRPDRWYDAKCARSGNSVALSVTEHLPNGNTRSATSTSVGATGNLSWPRTGLPLSIGGKLNAKGQISRASTDQFNGVISDPMLDISR